MFRIRRQFRLSAFHYLYNVEPNHPCSRYHGHEYVIEVEVADQMLDAASQLEDPRNMPHVEEILRNWDHKRLNEIVDFNPTPEMMAFMLYRMLSEHMPKLAAVRVHETSTHWAEYRLR